MALMNIASPEVPEKTNQVNVTTAKATTRLMMLIVQHTSSKYVPSKRIAGNVAKAHQLDKRNLTFLEKNNCGKLALNHYVHEEEHDVVVLNETKAKLPRTY